MKTFEDKMHRLEEIIEMLQSPQTGLEESVKLFEEGRKLADELYAELNKAQEKIELLTVKDNEPEYTDFVGTGGIDE